MKKTRISKIVSLLLIIGVLISGCGKAAEPQTEAPLEPPQALEPTQANQQNLPLIAFSETPTQPAPELYPVEEPAGSTETEVGQDIQEIYPVEAEVTSAYELLQFTFEGIKMGIPAEVASGAAGSIIPAVVNSEMGMVFDMYPDHFRIDMMGYLGPESLHDPYLRIFPLAELLEIAPYTAAAVEELKDLMADRPAEIPLGDRLPFLPIFNAGQMFATQSRYQDFINGSGIRYITMFGQALYPADNYNIFYTFQGLTADERYYVLAVLPVSSAILPDVAEMPDNWEAFNEFYDSYVGQLRIDLNDQPAGNFTPSLEALDVMIGSLEINP